MIKIYKIKDGQWDGTPPGDAVIQYPGDAKYSKVLSPEEYVTKNIVRIYNMLRGGWRIDEIDEKDHAKIIGYWLFAKRFNSYFPLINGIRNQLTKTVM